MPDSDGEVEDRGDLWSGSESVVSFSTIVGIELEEAERGEDEINVRERMLPNGRVADTTCVIRQTKKSQSRMLCSRLMWLKYRRSLSWRKKNIR